VGSLKRLMHMFKVSCIWPHAFTLTRHCFLNDHLSTDSMWTVQHCSYSVLEGQSSRALIVCTWCTGALSYVKLVSLFIFYQEYKLMTKIY